MLVLVRTLQSDQTPSIREEERVGRDDSEEKARSVEELPDQNCSRNTGPHLEPSD